MFKLIITFAILLFTGLVAFSQNRQPDLNDKPLQLLSKPRANYTEEARAKKAHGTVSLRITFLASGEIGGITVVKAKSKLQRTGLVDQAIEAAKQIKFIPEEKDGRPVSVVKVVEYNFNLY